MLPELHQPVGALIGKGAQEHGVEHAEERRGGPDRKKEGQHRGGGVSGPAPQPAQRVADVLEVMLQRGGPPHVARRFAHLGSVPDSAPRRETRLILVLSLVACGLGRHLLVEPQLILEIRFEPLPAQEVTEPAEEGGHAGLTTLRTAATSWSKAETSWASWRRPAGVRA